MLLTQKEAEDILEPHRDVLYDCVISAWQDYHSLLECSPHLFTSRTRANIIHDYMVSHARNKFDDKNGIRMRESGGLFLLEIEEKIIIRFKKLNEEKRSSNIPTQQTIDFLGQVELPGMPAHATSVLIGYELNRFQTELQSVAVACPNGKKNEWDFELNTIVTEEMADITAFPLPEASETPIRLRVEKSDRAEGQNG